MVGPVDQVGRCGAAPGHILPFRPIGVPLVAEGPDAVFVDHSVGVVHPAVKRGVVKGRTVFLAVGGVKRVGQHEVAPARVVACLAHRCAPLRGEDVQHHVFPFVGGEVERHHVIGLRLCQAHIHGAVKFAVDKDIDPGVVVGLLHRHQQVTGVAVDPDQGVVHSEMLHLHPGGVGRDRQRDGRGGRQDYSF